MTTAVVKGTLRLGEVGPEISGPAGSVLTFDPDGRTLRGAPAGSSGGLSAVESLGTTIVAPGGATTSADGPEHTALAVTGQATFPAGSKLVCNLTSGIAGDGAGLVDATLTLEVSLDGGTTFVPQVEVARGRFTSAGANDPLATMATALEVDLSGAPSFALRGIRANDAGAAASADFNSAVVAWAYSPA